MFRGKIQPMVEVVFDDTAHTVDRVMYGVAEVLERARANPAQTYPATFDFAYQGSKVSLVAVASSSDATTGVGLTVRSTAVAARTLLRAFRNRMAAQGYAPIKSGTDEFEWDLPFDFQLAAPQPAVIGLSRGNIDTEMTLHKFVTNWRGWFLGTDPQRNGYCQTHEYWVEDVRGRVQVGARFEGTGVVLSRQEVDEDPVLTVLVGPYDNVIPPRTARVTLWATDPKGVQVLSDIVGGERLVNNLGLLAPEWQADGTLQCVLLILP